MSTAEQITGAEAQHGEGAVWCDGWGGLRWVDMLVGDVLSLNAAGAVTRRHVGSVAACVRPRRAGGSVLAVERGFLLDAEDGTPAEYLGDLWPATPAVRMNEGGCDPDGRFYAGSMGWRGEPGAGALYRLDPEWRCEVVMDDVAISNGLAWSPDGTCAFFTDSRTQRIDVFDYDPRSGLQHRRPAVTIPAVAGSPDGLTVDRDGRLWVALWGGGAVRCYQPDGTLVEIVTVPTPDVTSCTFGGSGLGELFITTSRLRAEPDGRAGAVFRVVPGTPGLPVLLFDA